MSTTGHPAYGELRPVTPYAAVLLARNPSPMTLEGTNTWLLRAPGATEAVVVDPGPDDAGHLARTAAAAGRGPVILLTPGHPDHAAGARRPHEPTGAPGRALDPAHRRGGAGGGWRRAGWWPPPGWSCGWGPPPGTPPTRSASSPQARCRGGSGESTAREHRSEDRTRDGPSAEPSNGHSRAPARPCSPGTPSSAAAPPWWPTRTAGWPTPSRRCAGGPNSGRSPCCPGTGRSCRTPPRWPPGTWRTGRSGWPRSGTRWPSWAPVPPPGRWSSWCTPTWRRQSAGRPSCRYAPSWTTCAAASPVVRGARWTTRPAALPRAAELRAGQRGGRGSRGVQRAPGRSSGPAAQPFPVQDHHALALQPQPAAGGEVGERLVHRLAGRPDQLGQLLLGEVVGDPQVAAVHRAEPVGELQQLLRHPARHVGEDQVSQHVVGAAQPAGQHPEQPLGDLRPLGDPLPERLLGHPGQPGVGHRHGGGGPRPRVEQRQLAELVRRPHQRDQILPAVGRTTTQFDLASQYDVQAVARLALVEDHLAALDVDVLKLGGNQFRGLRIHVLEQSGPGQDLVHRTLLPVYAMHPRSLWPARLRHRNGSEVWVLRPFTVDPVRDRQDPGQPLPAAAPALQRAGEAL